MQPGLEIQDGFFENPSAIRAAVLNGRFSDYRSEADGVVYPSINANVPADVAYEFTQSIQCVMDRKIESPTIFARSMTAGERSPHKVHSDLIMGSYSAHVYLSQVWPYGGGTSFWRHDTQGYVHNEETDLTKLSLTTLQGWTRYLLCPGLFNRLLIHRAAFWHMAEPYRGWGRTPSEGRLVLTCFFKVA